MDFVCSMTSDTYSHWPKLSMIHLYFYLRNVFNKNSSKNLDIPLTGN